MNDYLNIEKWEDGTFGHPEKPGVYAVCMCRNLQSQEKIVYIGSSKNVYKRLNSANHVYKKLYNKSRFHVYTKSFMTNDYIEIEKKLIIKYKPPLNKQYIWH